MSAPSTTTAPLAAAPLSPPPLWLERALTQSADLESTINAAKEGANLPSDRDVTRVRRRLRQLIKSFDGVHGHIRRHGRQGAALDDNDDNDDDPDDPDEAAESAQHVSDDVHPHTTDPAGAVSPAPSSATADGDTGTESLASPVQAAASPPASPAVMPEPTPAPAACLPDIYNLPRMPPTSTQPVPSSPSDAIIELVRPQFPPQLGHSRYEAVVPPTSFRRAAHAALLSSRYPPHMNPRSIPWARRTIGRVPPVRPPCQGWPCQTLHGPPPFRPQQRPLHGYSPLPLPQLQVFVTPQAYAQNQRYWRM
ncbi:hypothetical protein A9K55_004989 [Cordyceps militaris]|uniref:Uncharacterized protein n=1 Tax=Cordyceps militaris TaxID=73501 RepID=A0A2H4SMT0_CORMI|nr:hypothetical protein A9K55_004989 [Cordyceps militaris]